jgi:hypothetical protein
LKCGRADEALEALEPYADSVEGEEAESMRKLIATLRSRAGGEDPEEEPARRIFTLEEARALWPRVRDLTAEAVLRYGQLSGDLESERETVVREWMREVTAMGVEIKGLWLVDFDSGAGYYCWKYPEPALNHFHGYEEGFGGRLQLN